MVPPTNPHDLLPLRPLTFAILLVLRETPLHGYRIMERANEHLGKRALVGPGTLYRTLKELRDDGLVEHVPPPREAENVDGRRQYYGLTDLGRRVTAAEARRVAGLLRAVDADDLLGEEARS